MGGHSLKVFKANFAKYFNSFYTYFLRAIYWGSVPAIIIYGNYSFYLIENTGLFAKPYSPMVIGVWHMITGQEEEQ